MTTGLSPGRGLLRRKPVSAYVTETGADSDGGELRRSVTLSELTAIGVGATVGTGIFFVLEEVVPEAGPAVVFSFLLAGVAAGLTAMCYAELASTIPVSGSAYSYSYAVLGEIVAYFIGWCLLLEYGLSASATSIGWSGYLNELLADLTGFRLPEALSASVWEEGGLINLPALLLVFLCCTLLLRGASESALVNLVMVIIKVGVLVLFIVVAATAFTAGNFTPFAPEGVGGIVGATSVIFFTYIGLDAVSTAGEEVHNPKRNLPLAIVSALVIVTTLYVLTAITAIGAQPIEAFDGASPELAQIMRDVTGQTWPSTILSAGAVISIFSVTLVVLYGQTRILFSMSRDGLMPSVFHDVDTRTGIPRRNTIIVGSVVGLLAALVPLDWIWDLVSLGTLVAFIVVSLGVMILRYKEPDLPRGFKVPLFPVLPILSIASCLFIMSGLAPVTFVVFGAWLALAAVTYLVYGRTHSVLGILERSGGDDAQATR
jgi:APA family basic amino acid/polyamine antiporter